MQYFSIEQHVRRRRNRPLIPALQFKGPAARRSPGQNSFSYIDGIKQHPAPVKRFRKQPLLSGFFKAKRRAPDAAASGIAASGTAAPEQGASETAAKKKPLFTRPVWMRNPFWASPAPACALGGIALASALILGMQNAPVMALPPGEDTSIRTSLASYAGISGAPLSVSGENTAVMPLDLMETFRWETYTVRPGDSVSRIAAERSVSMDAIIASNGIANARRLREGETIRIPNMDGIPYTVKRGDSLSKISAAMETPVEAILDANNMDSDTITVGMSLFIPGARMRAEDLKLALGELLSYPVRGRLSSSYGWRNDPISGARRFHAALDLAANTGTPVKASMDGKVSTVGLNSVYGKYIILSHDGGFQTLYAHLNTVAVAQGAYASRGSKIGEVGSTGYSTGPHLHFAVYKNGKPVNPLEYLH
ncbi:MAG: M23 family metallopeptidase [Treponema sp.]|jgi:murein DD-endopeptidase MepM/ murein hydrolase activator NlpD|nr:M23 family metallopeptidase [Treponema sp.]